MSIANTLQSMYTSLATLKSSINSSLTTKGVSEVTTLSEVPTAIESISTGIARKISNDDIIVPTGTYATATYLDLTFGVKVSYCFNGDVVVTMKTGTGTGYENLYFVNSSIPTGASIIANTTSDLGATAGKNRIQSFVIQGLSNSTSYTLNINISSLNSTYDYLTCNITIV